MAGATAPAAFATVGGAMSNIHNDHAKALVLVLAAVSLISAVVAYYGIINGTILNVGPFGPPEIAASLLISGAQIGSVLLVANVATANNRYQSDLSYVVDLRHFLLLQALLAAGAAIANRLGLRDRKRWLHVLEETLRPGTVPRMQFDDAQRSESRAAAFAAIGLLVAWAFSLAKPSLWLIFTVACASGIGMSFHIGQQSRVHNQLWQAEFPRART